MINCEVKDCTAPAKHIRWVPSVKMTIHLCDEHEKRKPFADEVDVERAKARHAKIMDVLETMWKRAI